MLKIPELAGAPGKISIQAAGSGDRAFNHHALLPATPLPTHPSSLLLCEVTLVCIWGIAGTSKVLLSLGMVFINLGVLPAGSFIRTGIWRVHLWIYSILTSR